MKKPFFSKSCCDKGIGVIFLSIFLFFFVYRVVNYSKKSDKKLKDSIDVSYTIKNGYKITNFITVKNYKYCIDKKKCSQITTNLENSNCNFGKKGDKNLSLNCINWFDAQNFCQFIGMELPELKNIKKFKNNKNIKEWLKDSYQKKFKTIYKNGNKDGVNGTFQSDTIFFRCGTTSEPKK